MERDLVRSRGERVQAYFDGFKAGLEMEVDAWNEPDEEIYARARRYAGE